MSLVWRAAWRLRTLTEQGHRIGEMKSIRKMRCQGVKYEEADGRRREGDFQKYKIARKTVGAETKNVHRAGKQQVNT